MHWRRLALAAGVLLALGVLGLLWLRARKPTAPVACPPGPDTLSLPKDDQLETPVFLGAAGGAVLLLDGARQSEPVALLPPGRHELRAEAHGHAAELTFRLDAFHPALFHAEPAGESVSLVFLGAACADCPPAERPERLLVEPAQQPFTDLEAGATRALSTGDWPSAAELLEQVQPGERTAAGFLRPASYVLQASGAHEEAHAALAAVKDAGLAALLGRYDASVKSEAAREHAYLVRRWNAVTEVYARLLTLEGGAPEAMQRASQDLARTSAEFAKVSKEGSAFGQRATLEDAEAQVKALVQQLRAARPFDCDFQARVSAAL